MITEKTGQSQTEEELFQQLVNAINELKDKDGALIPILQSAQNLFGYLPEYVLKHISSTLNIPYSEVAGVVTFYSFFSTTPRGKNLLRVCLGTACYVRGGKEVLAAIKNELKIDIGETTGDKLFTLEIGRCFGACSLAPVVMINDEVFQRVKPARIRDLLNSFRNKDEMEEDHE
ncbi:MAG: NAD(P)H-dependent oxidoreductase subunit E [Spirochaetes bacterium]|nr:NAD(P)H-dependent oxidoreductase subunit E [Spirochaetota bacterium]